MPYAVLAVCVLGGRHGPSPPEPLVRERSYPGACGSANQVAEPLPWRADPLHNWCAGIGPSTTRELASQTALSRRKDTFARQSDRFSDHRCWASPLSRLRHTAKPPLLPS